MNLIGTAKRDVEVAIAHAMGWQVDKFSGRFRRPGVVIVPGNHRTKPHTRVNRLCRRGPSLDEQLAWLETLPGLPRVRIETMRHIHFTPDEPLRDASMGIGRTDRTVTAILISEGVPCSAMMRGSTVEDATAKLVLFVRAEMAREKR